MIPYFDNRSVGGEIKVDLDVYYEAFLLTDKDLQEHFGREAINPDSPVYVGLNRQEMIYWRDRLVKERGITPIKTEYRRSSNGHIHLKLVMPQEVSVLDGFMLRAWFLDDKTRLELDLKRYLLTNDLNEMNRCFDEKANADGMKKCGPWIPLDCEPKGIPEKSELISRLMQRINPQRTIT